jgi:hypothetical protein
MPANGFLVTPHSLRLRLPVFQEAAQKEELSIYAMLYALCALLYRSGEKSVGKMSEMSVSFGWKKEPRNT